MRQIACATLFCALLGLAGCATPYRLPDQTLLRQPVLEFAKPNTGTPRELRVLYVHGISCTRTDYSAPFQVNLARALGADRDPQAPFVIRTWRRGFEDEVTVLEPKEDPINASLASVSARGALGKDNDQARRDFEAKLRRLDGEYRRYHVATAGCDDVNRELSQPATVAARRWVTGAGDRILFVEVTWSPLSETVKREHLGYDFLKPLPSDPETLRAHRKDRAWANKAIKEGIINALISDAVFYLGGSGEDVRAMTGDALDILLFEDLGALANPEYLGRNRHVFRTCSSDRDESREYLIVSESLGSRIVFDTLAGAGDLRGSCMVEALARSPVAVALFANQLPLLEVAQEAKSHTWTFLPIEAPDVDEYRKEIAGLARMTRDLAAVEPGEIHDDLAEFSELAQRCEEGITRILERNARDLFRPAAGMSAAVLDEVADRASLNGGRTHETCLEATSRASHLQILVDFRKEFVDDASPRERALTDVSESLKRFMRLADRPHFTLRGSSWRVESRLAEITAKEAGAAVRDCEARNPPCSVDDVKSRVATILERREWQFIAFSDPNDPLSYELDETWTKRDGQLRFTNAAVRIARPITLLRGPAGAVVHPVYAHTNHKFDLDVIGVLAGEERLSADASPRDTP